MLPVHAAGGGARQNEGVLPVRAAGGGARQNEGVLPVHAAGGGARQNEGVLPVHAAGGGARQSEEVFLPNSILETGYALHPVTSYGVCILRCGLIALKMASG